MSHFTMLVPADDENQLAEMLAPYYEQIEKDSPYAVFHVEYRKEDFEAEAKSILETIKTDDHYSPETVMLAQEAFDAEDYESVFQEWTYGQIGPDGHYGYYHNPNAKWDWYSIGGRWSGLLKLKESRDKIPLAGIGEGGAFNQASTDPYEADYAPAGVIDFKSMRQKRIDTELKTYDAYHAILSEKDRMSAAEYQSALFDAGLIMLSKYDEDRFSMSRDKFIESVSDTRLTHGFIDKDGKWHESSDMGWFGITTDHQDDFGKKFWEFIASLPAKQMLYVVDCHI